MQFLSWLEGLKLASSRRRTKRLEARGPRCMTTTIKLAVETLEDRSMPSFLGPVNYGVGTSPQAVVSADFNNDAVLDIAVANYSSSNVSVLLGNSDGTFQPAPNSTTVAYPRSVAVGDFDEDGMLDLVTANAGDVSVLLGNGNGTFQAPASIELGSSPASVAVGDFNADGKLDLGVTSNFFVPGYWGWYGYYPGYNIGYANVLIGNGSGAFATPSVSSLGNGTNTGTILADLNGDGKLDFASSSDYGEIFVRAGNGDGSLGNLIYSAYEYGVSSLASGDVNGDGKRDLIAANRSGSNVSVFLNNGLGSLAAAQKYATGQSPSFVALADFNGDGKPDLVTANTGDHTVSVLLGTGAGAFKPPLSVATGSSPIGLAVGDFNGDGRMDVATANAGSGDVSVLLNDAVWPALNAPSLSINDITITEGNVGTTAATFTVSLSAPSSQTVTVRYAAADGSATLADGDFQAASGIVTFAPGVTSQPVTVLVNGDRALEPSEYLYVRLTDSTNAFIGDSSGVAYVTDDEPYLWIDYGPVSIAEGNTGATNAVFTVHLSRAYDAPVSVNFSTFDGDTDFPYWGWYGYYEGPPEATAGNDFQAKSGTVTFAANETTKTIPIVIYGDRLAEADEHFSVNLSDPTLGAIYGAHAVGIIVDDEPRVAIGSATTVEGNTGTKNLAFSVILSAASSEDVIVSYETADNTAQAGSDYQAKSGTVTIPAGQTSATINVLVNGDRLGEQDEYFYVNLTGADGAIIIYPFGWGTIQDDEPRLSITGGSVTEGNKGTKLMTFTVFLSAAYDQTVTVHYMTNDWSATAGEDYVATSGTLTFSPGQTTKTFTVTINGDTKKESDEHFFVSMDNASSNALISYYEAGGNILNDDGGGKGGGNGKNLRTTR